MNKLLSSIQAYASKKISDKVSHDPSIINLSIGEPYFAPPKSLQENLLKFLASDVDTLGSLPNKYSDSRGEIELRRAVSQKYKSKYGATVNSEQNVLITHGAAEAIWIAILTATSEGDEIIIPDPSYVLYETAARLLGRIPVKLKSDPNDGYCLSKDTITKAITDKTKMIIINSPENPTGAIYDRQAIADLVSISEKNGTYFCHDEVYDEFVFGGVHENIFRHSRAIGKYSILINSFSKKFSMMGWRLGWMVAGSEFIDNATKVHTNFTLNLGSFHQKAAGSILNDPQIDQYHRKNLEQIRENIATIKEALDPDLFAFPDNQLPKGALFIFPNVERIYDLIPARFRTASISESVTDFLLENKIAVVPGIVYGPGGANSIRIVASIEPEQAIRAAKGFREISKLLPITLVS